MSIPSFVHEAFAKEAVENGYTVEFVRKALDNVPAYATEIEHKLRAVYTTWLKREEEEYSRLCVELEKYAHPRPVVVMRLKNEFPVRANSYKRWLKEHPEKDSAREVQDVREQFEKECAKHSRHYSTIVKATRWLDVAKDFFKVSEVLVQKYPTCPATLRFREETKEHVKAFAKKLAILRKEDELLAARCKVKFISSKLEEDKKAYDEAYEKKATTTMELHKASEEVTTLSKQLEELKK